MRDTLALALIRAEFCRAYAAERSRSKDKESTVGAGGLRARLGRSIRALRRPRLRSRLRPPG